MKSRIVMLTILASLMFFASCKKAGQDVVSVQFTVGDVKIVSASGEKSAAPGDVLSYEDSVVTGPSSAVDLNFGTWGVIRITDNSTVKLSAIKADTGNDQVQFDMKNGRLFVVMSKLTKGSSFSVLTPTTLAAVRGTSFMVVSDPKNSQISVLKGQILVQLAREGKLAAGIEKMLDANKKVVVSEDLAKEIIAGKKKMEVAALTKKEIAEIQTEIKKIQISDKLAPEAQKELEEIKNAEVKPDADKNQMQGPQNKDIQSVPSL